MSYQFLPLDLLRSICSSPNDGIEREKGGKIYLALSFGFALMNVVGGNFALLHEFIGEDSLRNGLEKEFPRHQRAETIISPDWSSTR